MHFSSAASTRGARIKPDRMPVTRKHGLDKLRLEEGLALQGWCKQSVPPCRAFFVPNPRERPGTGLALCFGVPRFRRVGWFPIAWCEPPARLKDCVPLISHPQFCFGIPA